MLQIDSFDKQLDATIVKRERGYFKDDCVKDLEQVDEGVWRALVEGTAVYDVTVTLLNNQITHHRCSCPYDLGEYCKHEVAVLYAIRKKLAGDSGVDEKEIAIVPQNIRKSKTVRREIQDALDKINEQELRQIVLDNALENKKLRRKILSAVPSEHDESPSQMKDVYMSSIRSCMEENTGKHGFIGYYEARSACEEADALCEKAKQYIISENYIDALPIGQALLEAIYPELGSIDDSNGEFGACIEEGWDILRTIADNVSAESTLGGELFDYCLHQAGSKVYDGWSTENDFLDVASQLTNDDERMGKLFAVVDRVLLCPMGESSWHAESMAEQAAKIKLAVLRKVGKKAEADMLIQQSIIHPNIREIYLKDLFSAKKFDEAKEVAREGILVAGAKGHHGTERRFEEWLCRIAEAENDIPTIRKFLRKFFVDRHDSSNYQKLKDSFKNDKQLWQEEFERLVAGLRKKGANWALFDLFIAEEKWDDFLAQMLEYCRKEQQFFLPSDKNLNLIERYEKVLREHFPENLISLYTDEIQKSLKGSPQGRGHYQYICRLLRRMKKWGAEGVVVKIKEDLLSKYAVRKALLDELSRV